MMLVCGDSLANVYKAQYRKFCTMQYDSRLFSLVAFNENANVADCYLLHCNVLHR